MVYGKQSYCATHLQAVRKEYDSKRPSAADRGYDAEWRKVRDEFLRSYPYCARCGVRATTVHHVIRKDVGGSDNWNNLEALCTRCHNSETMRHDVR